MIATAIGLCIATCIITVMDIVTMCRASERIPITDKRWDDLFGGSTVKKHGIVSFALFRFVTFWLYCTVAVWCMVINSQAVLPTLVPLGIVNVFATCYNQHICWRSVQ